MPPTVEHIMSREPACIAPGATLRAARELMRERNCRRLPVVENGKLVGILSDRDVSRATNSPFILRERNFDDALLDQLTVRACMSQRPITVTPRTPIVDAAKLMRDRKIGGLPVVDKETLVGIVTETDLLHYLIRLLEGQA